MTKSEANTTAVRLGRLLAATDLPVWQAYDIICETVNALFPLDGLSEGQLSSANLKRLIASNYGRGAFAASRKVAA